MSQKYKPTTTSDQAKAKRYSTYQGGRPNPKYAPGRYGRSTVPRTMGPMAAGVGETKYYDTQNSGTAIASSTSWTNTTQIPTALVNTLCVPTVGSAINQRIGRKIKIHKIRIHGHVRVPQQAGENAPDPASFIRILLVKDSQTNGVQATGTEIMTASLDPTVRGAVLGFQSLASLGRFTVLKDLMIKMDDPNLAAPNAGFVVQQGMVRFFKFSVKFSTPLVVNFNAVNGGSVGDIVDNSFMVYANCDQNNLAPELAYRSRVYYKE